MHWARSIDIEQHLEGDLRLIYDACGEDVLLALLDQFAGMPLHLSDGPVREMKREYIQKHGGPFTDRELARRLDMDREAVKEARP